MPVSARTPRAGATWQGRHVPRAQILRIQCPRRLVLAYHGSSVANGSETVLFSGLPKPNALLLPL